MIKSLLGMTALAALAASPAAAQDGSYGSSDGAWNGPYFGVLFGANQTEADGGYVGLYPGPDPTPPPPPPPSPPGSPPAPPPPPPPPPAAVTSGSAENNPAFNLGLIGGYDIQYGRWVLGAQVDLSFQTHDDIEFSQIAGTPVKDTLNIDWRGHALLRYGVDYEGWLLYLTGGAAFANISATHTGLTSPIDIFKWEEDSVRLGYSYGVGAERSLGNGWSMRGEYLYDYWDAERYDWVPNQRYSDIAVTINEVRIALTRRY